MVVVYCDRKSCCLSRTDWVNNQTVCDATEIQLEAQDGNSYGDNCCLTFKMRKEVK
jgi:hypothetical protein